MKSGAGLARVLQLFLVLALFAPAVGAQNRDDDSPGIPSATSAAGAGGPESSPLVETDPIVLAGPIDPARYRLGPGDVLSLELSGRTLRQNSLAVDAEGRINVPELGVIEVGGRTLESARAEVVRRLKGIYSGVRVDLRLVQVRQFKVFVAGQVKTPGVGIANGAMRASELFHGPLELLKGASRRNIELRRRDGDRLRVDLDAFAYMGRDADDPQLEDGDVLIVPTLTERVYALGAFGRPGEYEYAPKDSISDLVGLAGGLLPGAEATHGILVRFTGPNAMDSTVVDLAAVMRGVGDRPLSNQDRLFAHAPADFMKPRNVTLVGEVTFPGPYSVNEGVDRVSTVIARAGGLTAAAARDRIQVFRPGENSGQRDIEFERLSRLSRSDMTDAEYQIFKTKLASQQSAFLVSMRQLEDSTGKHDITVRDGDVIVVDRETQAVRVAGEVRRPSLIEYEAGRRPQEYIELAGGFSGRAQRNKVRVTHAGSNQTLLLTDVKSIEPGDFIWVPERSDVSFWAVFKDMVTVLAAVATIVVVIDNTSRR